MPDDLKRSVPGYRARHGVLELLDLPPLRYLALQGHGDPNTSERYADSVRTLYPLAYALKTLGRRELGVDLTVMPLEAQWWADDHAVFTSARDKSAWSWRAMILAPEWVGADHLKTARAGVAAKGGAPRLDAVRLEAVDEGLAMQTLHLGPYDDEGPVLERMHAEIDRRGLRLAGRHHEIYLGDPRRSAPERLRTILRQPVAR